VALDDFRPHCSDIDFVAVSADYPDAQDLAALQRVHSRLGKHWRRPYFDGIYVTWGDLTRDPACISPGPSAHESRFYASGRGEWNPVTWHTLARHGVRCRGPAVAALPIWNDPAVLAAWTNDNLDTYWRRWLARGARLFTPGGMAQLTAWACAWCVLGVSRLHYTLATAAITSKAGAGIYALTAFPEKWQRVIEEALRIRRGAGGRSAYRSPLARRRAARAFSAEVIADAHRLYLHHGP
jgi:hypothetical protein